MITCRECNLTQTDEDGNEWMKDRKNNFCSWGCYKAYEKKREQQDAYQLALSFSTPLNPDNKNPPFRRQTFKPRKKAPDPIIQEALAILREKRNETKVPPIPLSLYFSLLKRGVQIPPSAS